MGFREVIEIDPRLCDGCGDCVTACAEGAITIVDGVATLISDAYCDGLGACLGHCPRGALQVVRREAADFDVAAVERHLARGAGSVGPKEHSELAVLGQQSAAAGGCPGSRARQFDRDPAPGGGVESGPSQLRHWPVQLHLVPPTAPFFRRAEVVLAADCVAFAIADFHDRFLAGKSLAIACPKLDSNQQTYLEKLVAMIDHAEISRLQVIVMEVPCCAGLLRLAEEARRRARRTVVMETIIVGTNGTVVDDRRIAG
jgi:Pyruvate/2-oxoacid:ferredoxin oxidoreductase delta subunit